MNITSRHEAARHAGGFADADLISRVILKDDRNAFAELVRRHQSTLRASVRKMTGGQIELSDDIAQETFILAWRNIRSFRFEAKFSTWLYRIAFNVWQSDARKKHETPMADEHMPDPEPVEAESNHSGVKRDLARAMECLSDAERDAIVQCYYNDLSHEEAAYVLGIPLGTVKTNILKAKEKMRARLGAYQNTGQGAAA
jgi:RNA polymerase sigma-70 factor (ECF subfamily)